MKQEILDLITNCRVIIVEINERLRQLPAPQREPFYVEESLLEVKLDMLEAENSDSNKHEIRATFKNLKALSKLIQYKYDLNNELQNVEHGYGLKNGRVEIVHNQIELCRAFKKLYNELKKLSPNDFATETPALKEGQKILEQIDQCIRRKSTIDSTMLKGEPKTATPYCFFSCCARSIRTTSLELAVSNYAEINSELNKLHGDLAVKFAEVTAFKMQPRSSPYTLNIT